MAHEVSALVCSVCVCVCRTKAFLCGRYFTQNEHNAPKSILSPEKFPFAFHNVSLRLSPFVIDFDQVAAIVRLRTTQSVIIYSYCFKMIMIAHFVPLFHQNVDLSYASLPYSIIQQSIAAHMFIQYYNCTM